MDFRVDAVHASGDIKIMKDEGAEATSTNGFTDEGNGYSLVLSATEMQAARIVVYIIDQTATKAWLDKSIVIETYGHASAQHAFDLDAANVTLAAATHTGAVIPTVTTLTNLPAITANWITAAGITDGAFTAAKFAASSLDGKGDWNVGKTGYTLTQSFPTNFADLDITATAGEVSLKAATQASVDAIEADTNELQTDFTDGGRLDLLLDRLITELDTARAEPGQGPPAATTKIGDKIDYLYKAWRNKSTQTATQYSLYDDSGTTIDQKATVSDDATTGTKGEVGTGP